MLDALAFAGYEYFVLAWLVFFAGCWGVARCRARVAADAQFLAAGLLAWFFAVSGAMALLFAEMGSAF